MRRVAPSPERKTATVHSLAIISRYHISTSALLIHSTNNEKPRVRGRRLRALGPSLLLIVVAVMGKVLVYLWFAGY